MIQSIDTDAGKLNVAVHGTGPAMMFWPSLFMDAGMYREQLSHFSEHHTAIAVDGPGHGGSGPAPQNVSVETYAQAACQVLEHLEVGPVIFVGSSWGGLVGVTLAAAFPHLVAGLVVSGAPLDPPGSLERLGNHALATGFRLFGGTGSFQHRVLANLFSPDFIRTQPSAVNAAAHALRTADRAAMVPVLRSVLVNRGSAHGAARLVRCPTLVLAGECDQVVRPSNALAHSRLFAQGSFEVLPGCGHLAASEDAASFNQAVDRLIQRLPEPPPANDGVRRRIKQPKLPSLYGPVGSPAPL